MRVDLWMPYVLMLVSMALILMQDHTGSTNAPQKAVHAFGN